MTPSFTVSSTRNTPFGMMITVRPRLTQFSTRSSNSCQPRRCVPTLGTVTSSIDFSDIMDNRKILIANLSKGVLGPGHAQLLGSILVSGFSHATMARAAIDERARVPFFLYADEIENFATDSFGEIASEARKMKLA